jgi:glutamate/tyrosine decarboxylase-like PLP-dependent enzyme
VFFRNHDLATDQTFVFDEWAAGLYRSPVVTGTRSGGAIASAWAVARYLGREGYRRRTAQVLKARDAIAAAVEQMPDTVLLGGADLGTVAIGSDTISVAELSNCLGELGWPVNRLKNPDGIQLVLGPIKDCFIDEFVADLRRAVVVARGRNAQSPTADVVYSDEVVSGPGSILGEQ